MKTKNNCKAIKKKKQYTNWLSWNNRKLADWPFVANANVIIGFGSKVYTLYAYGRNVTSRLWYTRHGTWTPNSTNAELSHLHTPLAERFVGNRIRFQTKFHDRYRVCASLWTLFGSTEKTAISWHSTRMYYCGVSRKMHEALGHTRHTMNAFVTMRKQFAQVSNTHTHTKRNEFIINNSEQCVRKFLSHREFIIIQPHVFGVHTKYWTFLHKMWSAWC